MFAVLQPFADRAKAADSAQAFIAKTFEAARPNSVLCRASSFGAEIVL
jgi:hypothetical protein